MVRYVRVDLVVILVLLVELNSHHAFLRSWVAMLIHAQLTTFSRRSPTNQPTNPLDLASCPSKSCTRSKPCMPWCCSTSPGFLHCWRVPHDFVIQSFTIPTPHNICLHDGAHQSIAISLAVAWPNTRVSCDHWIGLGWIGLVSC